MFRFAVSFTLAWALVGAYLGALVGIWTAAHNRVDTFVGALALDLVVAATFAGLFAGCGLALALAGAALRAAWPRGFARYRPGELGFASAVAGLAVIYAARRFEFEAAYPDLYPWVHGLGPMLAVALAFLALAGAAAAGLAVGLAEGAAWLRRRGRTMRLRAAAAALAGLVAVGAAGAGLRPAPLDPSVVSPSSGVPRVRPAGNVLLVGCDGADWRVIDRLLAQGELPAIRELLDRGVRAPLRTIQNHPSPTLWTSIATSKSPREHGILDFYVQEIGSLAKVSIFPRHLGLNSGLLLRDVWGDRVVRVSPVHAGMVRSERVWEILAANGVSVGVVNWLVSWPARPGAEFLVTDRTFAAVARSREEGRPPSRDDEGGDAPLWYPPEIDALVQRTAAMPGLDREDEFVGALSLALHDRFRPRVLLVYFRDVDAAEHLHWDEYEPEYSLFDVEGDSSGSPIPAVYRRFDRSLGDLVDLAGNDAIVLVVSDHGHGSWFTWFGRGTPGGHTNAPDGIFLAAGPGIVPGRLEEAVSCYDVTPTLLRLAGLPPAADMRGEVLHEILDEGSLSPPTIVATYETGARGDGDLLPGRGDEQLFENLRALGYIR